MTSIGQDVEDPAAQEQIFKLERARLECKKLEAEINQANLAWWKRPGYIGGLAPIVLSVIGFLSVASSGYFDTKREILNNAVENLKTEKTQLETTTKKLSATQAQLSSQNEQLISENDKLLEKVDKTYISLSVAGNDLSYAVDHITTCNPPLSAQDRATLEKTDDPSRANIESIVNRLVRCHDTVHVILPITRNSFQDFVKRLSKLPASAWAKQLKPEIGPYSILRSPDGRVYHPATSKFYGSIDELKQALGE